MKLISGELDTCQKDYTKISSKCATACAIARRGILLKVEVAVPARQVSCLTYQSDREAMAAARMTPCGSHVWRGHAVLQQADEAGYDDYAAYSPAQPWYTQPASMMGSH